MQYKITVCYKMEDLLYLLAVMLLFVVALKVAEGGFILICRVLPKRQRLAIYNWLCANVFVEEVQ